MLILIKARLGHARMDAVPGYTLTRLGRIQINGFHMIQTQIHSINVLRDLQSILVNIATIL